jgi:2-polyprenyl-3-methyl-5-hydroxy-6-metoxy-1,4-benzoquinol methylase
MNCRHCNTELKNIFCDLGFAPPSNSYLTKEQLSQPEIHYPLKAYVCHKCFLTQIGELKNANEIFNSNYAYFSSYSSTWLAHAKNTVELLSKKLGLNRNSQVIEIASNDGYLLQYAKAKNIPCLGIEPSTNTAKIAKQKGIKVIEKFFDSKLASKLPKADWLLGNNVLAHVPNINDFVKGLKIALKQNGTITMEFPHLLNLIELNQFDTIYHEHYSYLSLIAAQKIFAKQNLKIYAADELPTHGGSLRIYATHTENSIKIENSVKKLLEKERQAQLNSLNGYKNFQNKIRKIKTDLLKFMLANNKGDVVGYGAAAKGNTLLNYCGIGTDILNFVVDLSPYKQGLFLPQSHIPIVVEKAIKKAKPKYILILPWNLREEISKQLSYVRKWGAKFVVAVPRLEIW